MKNVKILSIDDNCLIFEDGIKLYSLHERECCEEHYLNFADLTLDDFSDLEFDFTNDNFFERIEGYGIALIPAKGFPVRIAGYSNNNGEYSSYLTLVLKDGKGNCRRFDITECQSEV